MQTRGHSGHSQVNAFTHRAKGSCWQLHPKTRSHGRGLGKGRQQGWVGLRPLAGSWVTVLSLMTPGPCSGLGGGGGRLASDPFMTYCQAPSGVPRGAASWVP